MRTLLVYPRFPPSFWSFEPILRLVGKKALMPPLGLLTVAALLPEGWECRLADRNVGPVSEADWDWAELVLVSGMLAQRSDLHQVIDEARDRRKPVVVGGPYASALPDRVRDAGADFLVLDEAELSLPAFLDALAAGATGGTFTARGAKPELIATPPPRFDLLDLDAYDSMCVQFSRGCPFLCEFCDITVLYGRRPRTKTPAQMLAEYDRLYALGWRGPVFIVDDNFIGNRKAARELLRETAHWQARHGYPFHFDTEATIELADDQQLLDLMVACKFGAVFIGIETPDEASLARTGKHQNLRSPLDSSVRRITRAGIRVMAGFIVGFDHEEPRADERIVEFIERTAVPTAALSMLQALPGTALWQRLERENRLREESPSANQTSLTNFVTTRPIEQVASEYVNAFRRLYDPIAFLDRTWRYFLEFGADRDSAGPKAVASRSVDWTGVRALLTVVWRQGVRRRSRWVFWHHLVSILRHNPEAWEHYLVVCAHNEHFLVFRELIQHEITAQVRLRTVARTAGRAEPEEGRPT